jgi:histone deacetylase HOS1
MLDLDTPTLLLGGGGYNHQQAARFWTYVTSLALDLQMEFDILPDVITEEDEDNYDFWNVKPKNMIDENDDVYIDHLKSAILNRLN